MKAESNIGGLLGKASRLLSNELNNSLSEHKLTVEQWSLLAVLWTQDGQKQKELQQELLKDKATINSLVSYLLKDGFITKKRNEYDKRSFIISLTQKGKEMQKHTIPLAMQSISMSIVDIDADALQTTTKVLTQIINNLTKEKS